MECFADVTTEADAELGYSTARTSTPTKMFVSLSDIMRKVILFEPPACNEARVLRCWTKGRVFPSSWGAVHPRRILGDFREFLMRSRLQVLKQHRLSYSSEMIWFDNASFLVHLGCGIVLSKVDRLDSSRLLSKVICVILSAMLLTRATWILPMREDFVPT